MGELDMIVAKGKVISDSDGTHLMPPLHIVVFK